MVSTLTISRRRKVKLLKESLLGIIDLLLMQHRNRDFVHMKHFKELSKKVKSMLELAK